MKEENGGKEEKQTRKRRRRRRQKRSAEVNTLIQLLSSSLEQKVSHVHTLSRNGTHTHALTHKVSVCTHDTNDSPKKVTETSRPAIA